MLGRKVSQIAVILDPPQLQVLLLGHLVHLREQGLWDLDGRELVSQLVNLQVQFRGYLAQLLKNARIGEVVAATLQSHHLSLVVGGREGQRERSHALVIQEYAQRHPHGEVGVTLQPLLDDVGQQRHAPKLMT